MTIESNSENINTVNNMFAIIYQSCTGFDIFETNIQDEKLLTNLTTIYPSLLGVMQDQEPVGLATQKLNNGHYLYSYVFYAKNTTDKDSRLHKRAMIVSNFIVSKKKNRSLLFVFDEFEKYLDSCFQSTRKIEDLADIDFTKIIPQFLDLIECMNFSGQKCISFDDIEEISFAREFTKWLKEVDVRISS